MINLGRHLRESSNKSRAKSIYTGNKSHTASTNLRVSQEYCGDTCQTPLKNITNRNEERGREERSKEERGREDDKSRSAKKYKHSITLQDTTIHLVKKASEQVCSQRNVKVQDTSRVSETERVHRDTFREKRSIDNLQNALVRIKTDMTEGEDKQKPNENVQISREQMKAFLKKLNDIRKQRDMMLKELRFYKRQCAKEEVGNTVLRALRE